MTEQIIISSAAIIGSTVLALIVLRGWQGWLSFKERELERRQEPHRHHAPEMRSEMEDGAGVGAARIEIADLKERIRKLEAIASGVDL